MRRDWKDRLWDFCSYAVVALALILFVLFTAPRVKSAPLSDADDAAAALALAAARRHAQEQAVPVEPVGSPNLDYADFYVLVKDIHGYGGLLYVGVPITGGSYLVRCHVPHGWNGFADGIYRCWSDKNGKLWMEPWKAPGQEVQPSTAIPFGQNTAVPSRDAGSLNTSSPGVAQSQARIRILAPTAIRGGIWTSNCPTGVG